MDNNNGYVDSSVLRQSSKGWSNVGESAGDGQRKSSRPPSAATISSGSDGPRINRSAFLRKQVVAGQKNPAELPDYREINRSRSHSRTRSHKSPSTTTSDIYSGAAAVSQFSQSYLNGSGAALMKSFAKAESGRSLYESTHSSVFLQDSPSRYADSILYAADQAHAKPRLNSSSSIHRQTGSVYDFLDYKTPVDPPATIGLDSSSANIDLHRSGTNNHSQTPFSMDSMPKLSLHNLDDEDLPPLPFSVAHVSAAAAKESDRNTVQSPMVAPAVDALFQSGDKRRQNSARQRREAVELQKKRDVAATTIQHAYRDHSRDKLQKQKDLEKKRVSALEDQAARTIQSKYKAFRSRKNQKPPEPSPPVVVASQKPPSGRVSNRSSARSAAQKQPIIGAHHTSSTDNDISVQQPPSERGSTRSTARSRSKNHSDEKPSSRRGSENPIDDHRVQQPPSGQGSTRSTARSKSKNRSDEKPSSRRVSDNTVDDHHVQQPPSERGSTRSTSRSKSKHHSEVKSSSRRVSEVASDAGKSNHGDLGSALPSNRSSRDSIRSHSKKSSVSLKDSIDLSESTAAAAVGISVSEPDPSTAAHGDPMLEHFFKQNPRQNLNHSIAKSGRSDISNISTGPVGYQPKIKRGSVASTDGHLMNPGDSGRADSSSLRNSFSHFAPVVSSGRKTTQQQQQPEHQGEEELESIRSSEVPGQAFVHGRKIDTLYRNFRGLPPTDRSGSASEIEEASSLVSGASSRSKKPSIPSSRLSARMSPKVVGKHEVNLNASSVSEAQMPAAAEMPDEGLIDAGKYTTIMNYLEQLSQADDERMSEMSFQISQRSARTSSTLKEENAVLIANTQEPQLANDEEEFYVVVKELLSEKRVLGDLCAQLLRQVQQTSERIIELESKQETNLEALIRSRSVVPQLVRPESRAKTPKSSERVEKATGMDSTRSQSTSELRQWIENMKSVHELEIQTLKATHERIRSELAAELDALKLELARRDEESAHHQQAQAEDHQIGHFDPLPSTRKPLDEAHDPEETHDVEETQDVNRSESAESFARKQDEGIQEIRNEVEALLSDQDDLKNRLVFVADEKDQLEALLTEKDKEISLLKSQVDQIADEHSELNTHLSAEFTTRIEQLHKENEELRHELEKLHGGKGELSAAGSLADITHVDAEREWEEA